MELIFEKHKEGRGNYTFPEFEEDVEYPKNTKGIAIKSR
jgi:hypothetical protein